MMAPSEMEIRACMCDVGRRLYARNLVTATDGNLSVRLDDARFLVTASGTALATLHPHDLVVVDAKGEKLEGEGRVSSEFFTHLAAYEERPDVRAVVHAHPPKAVAFTLVGHSLERLVLPEVVFALGGVPTAPYATPGTREGAESVRSLVRECDALLMDRHGALTLGPTLMDAFHKMEKIEHAAETLFSACLMGELTELSSDQTDRILAAREAYGATGKNYRPSGLPVEPVG